MSPSVKKRPKHRVVFKVGLRAGPRGGLTKRLTIPRAGGGQGRSEGQREVMVSPFLSPNQGDKVPSLGLVRRC